MTDWSNPTKDSKYTQVPALFKERDVDIATRFLADPTNPEFFSIAVSRALKVIQQYTTGAAESGSFMNVQLGVPGGGTGGLDDGSARDGLGIGNLALQNAINVLITAGKIKGLSNLNLTSSLLPSLDNKYDLGQRPDAIRRVFFKEGLVTALEENIAGPEEEEEPPPPPPPPPPPIGSGLGPYPKLLHPFMFPGFQNAKNTAFETALEGLKGTQLISVQNKFEWDKVEPTVAGEGLWTLGDGYGYNGLVSKWWDNGFNVRALIMSTPQWSHNNGTAPGDNLRLATNPQDFADFCVRFLQHFGRWGTFARTDEGHYISTLMIWDEPNLTMHDADGNNVPDPVGFALLMAAVYATVKAYDPTVTIIHGGLSYGGTGVVLPGPWMTSFLASGGLNTFDTLGLNPLNGDDPDDMDAKISQARSFIDVAGMPTARIFVSNIVSGISLNQRPPDQPHQDAGKAVLEEAAGQIEALYDTWAPKWRADYGLTDFLQFCGPDTAEIACGLYESQDFTNPAFGGPGTNGTPKYAVYDKWMSGLTQIAPATVSNYPKGISNNLVPGYLGDDDQIRFDLMKDLVGDRKQRILGRTPLRWDNIAPTRGVFDFGDPGGASGMNYLIKRAFTDGWDVMLQVEQTAGYAKRPGTTTINAPPKNSDITIFWTGVVTQYMPGGTFTSTLHPTWGVRIWQLHNEPNLPSNQVDWPPDVWAEVTAVSAAAIKAVDPNAIILAAGLSFNSAPLDIQNYLNNFYASSFLDLTNIHSLACHPYSGSSLDAAQTKIDQVRAVMNANGDNARKLALTEWGMSTTDGLPNVGKCGDNMAELFNVRISQWGSGSQNTSYIFYYSLSEGGAGPTGLGMVLNDGTIKHPPPEDTRMGPYEQFKNGLWLR